MIQMGAERRTQKLVLLKECIRFLVVHAAVVLESRRGLSIDVKLAICRTFHSRPWRSVATHSATVAGAPLSFLQFLAASYSDA